MTPPTAPTTAAYEYTPLRTPTSIRVLEVATHSPTHPLHLLIRQIDLDSHPTPPFRCLSYTWGTPFTHRHPSGHLDPARWSAQHPILLSDAGSPAPRLASVTTNLHEFLLQLRSSAPGSPDANLPIWIDALSIHQADLAERAQQVNLMGRIYRSCTESLIWLGEAGQETSTVFRMMDGLSRIAEQDWDPLDETWYRASDEQIARLVGLLERFDVPFSNVHAHLAAFFARTWFHRIWTIQECKLPARLQLWSGAHRAPDFEVLDRLAVLLDVCFTRLRPVEQDREKEVDTAEQSRYRLMLERDIDPVIYYLRRFVFRSPADAMAGIKTRRRRQTHSLSQCMARARHKACADPRDRVYGLLGMLAGPLPVVRADYAVAVEEVYTRVVATGAVGEFFRTREDDAVRKMADLPSWVPDWSSPLEPQMWMDRGGNGMYCAGGGEGGGKMEVRIAQRVLGTEGVEVDVVGGLGGTHKETVEGEGLIRSLEMVRDAYAERGEVPGLVERFWRTSIADLPGSGCWHPRREEHGPAFAAFCLDRLAGCLARDGRLRDDVEALLTDLLRLDPEAHLPSWQQVSDAAKGGARQFDGDAHFNPYASSLDRMFQLRRFFLTERGRMGVASQGAQPGDAIVVVKNVQYPFLMRRLASGRYRYLSLAYVDGIMRGESLGSNAFGGIEIE